MANATRRTMTSDVAKLRALAVAGVSMREAARRTGLHRDTIKRLRDQFDLPFYRRPAVLLTCALAMARLKATMQRLRMTDPNLTRNPERME